MSSDARNDDQAVRDAKVLATNVEAVKQYALDHYTEGGWDVIVECWDDQQIADFLREAETDDVASDLAIDSFRGVISVWADRQADARNSAF